LDACTFSNNVSDIGGGVAVGTDATPVLTDCIFEGNTADTYGGGLSCKAARATVADCAFRNNHAPSGGAINVRVEGSEIVTTNCTFEGNTASSTGGGVAAMELSSAILTGCNFFGNSASAGAAISCSGNAALTLSGSTLYGNDGPAASGLMFSTVSPCTIDNSIIAFGIGGAAMTGSGTPPTLTCSDIYGNDGGDWIGYIADQYGVNGNISEDPLFCGAENGDFTLDSDSPCLPSNHPDGPGTCGLIGSHGIGCGSADVDETAGLERDRLYLAPGRPNPFVSSSRITYAIPSDADMSWVRLNVYNAEGRLVRTLVQEPQAAGMHHVTWDGESDSGARAAGGVYFYQLTFNGETQTRRLILVR
jgi:predicted outer membrane repeat protein